MSKNDGHSLENYLNINKIDKKEFSKKIDMSRANLYNLFKKKELMQDLKQKLAAALDTSVDTIFTPENNFEQINNESLVWLPFIPVSARAGLSNYPNISDSINHVNETFPVYRGQLPRNYEDCVIVEVNGDSMEPTLQNGDKVLCRILDRTVWQSAQKIVVIVTAKDFIIKTVVLNKGKELIVTSDNPAGKKNIEVDLTQVVNLYQVIELVARKLV